MQLVFGCILTLLLSAYIVFGATLHVPGEYATIQSALNNTAPNDTVLVDIGVYAETIIMPNRRVVLKGNVEPDTGLFERPVIDPSTLVNPQSRRCLTTSNSGSIIEDMTFRNGPAMFPRGPFDLGGVSHIDSSGIFRRCVWDSTYVGIRATARLRLEDCIFVDNINVCVDAANYPLVAENTSFQGRTGGWAVLAIGSGSMLHACRMTTSGQGQNLLALGDAMTISNCEFGPFERSEAPIVEIRGRMNSVDSCVFHDCNVANSVIFMESPCETPSSIRNSDFFGNYLHNPSSAPNEAMIKATSTQNSSWCFGVEVCGNTLRDAQADRGARASAQRGNVLVCHNRITGTAGIDFATVYCADAGTVVRDNIFSGNRQAVSTQDFTTCLAEYNWWGDLTGPYHPDLNPQGLGDAVGDSVDFDPWYTDTLFFSASLEPRPPLPERASLLAYPNPFNSVVTFKLTVPRAMIARIELFDVTGRLVKEVWSGAVAETKEVSFSAGDFASGLYFVRAWDPLGNRPLAMAKVVLLK